MVNTSNIIIVDDINHGKKIEYFIIDNIPSLSLAEVRKFLRTGQIRADSGRVKPGKRILKNQKIRIPPFLTTQIVSHNDSSFLVVNDHMQDFIQKMIIYQDEHILVINKPAGLASQGGIDVKDYNVDILFKKFAEMNNIPRPLLVHRLDKDTAGVMVLAKNAFIATNLSEAFQQKSMEKHYFAITYSTLKAKKGVFDTNIEKDVNIKKSARDMEKKNHLLSYENTKSLFAQTYYEIIDMIVNTQGQCVSLIKLVPKTGRKHQIRKHLAYNGCPIVGDKRYGPKSYETMYIHTKHMYLLAKRIKFIHPFTNSEVVFTVDLPDFFQNFIEKYGLNCYDIQ